MIPLCLVTGFLGSGKTTFLQNLVKQHQDRKLVYLVNDFAAVDIDGQLLDLPQDQLVQIAGGSIFCKCLVTDFIRHLTAVAEHVEEHGTEGVIIEASGIADPRVIPTMLQETKLDHLYTLSSIISVVDPGRFMKLIHTLPNIRAQIEAADHVLINKIDLYSEEELNTAEKEIRDLNPECSLDRCKNSDVHFSPFRAWADRNMEGEYAKCADPNYFNVVAQVPGGYDEAALREVLTPLLPQLYRIKGFVPTTQRLLYVDYSGGDLSFTPDSEADNPALILIGQGDAEQIVRDALSTAGIPLLM